MSPAATRLRPTRKPETIEATPRVSHVLLTEIVKMERELEIARDIAEKAGRRSDTASEAYSRAGYEVHLLEQKLTASNEGLAILLERDGISTANGEREKVVARWREMIANELNAKMKPAPRRRVKK